MTFTWIDFKYHIKVSISYQSLYLLNFVVRTNFISFFNWQTILFSWGSTDKFQRGYCVIIICLHGQSATTLFASKHDHRMSRSIKFVIARRKSQSNCYFKFLPAISLFCPLFHIFARYFNKNSKTINQSDLRNNAQHVIRPLFAWPFTKYGHITWLRVKICNFYI